MEAAVAIDFNALSRRELQAMCKLNGVRANMTNHAMAEALQSLPSVNGIDEIGTTLCLPTPGKSAMKSVLKAESAIREDQQQQHGSPLPRGRRVSVKSPEAIRMDVEGGEDEMKRDLIKDIVRTPGVALRSTSCRPRATPAPIPTPAPGTLRRSHRSTARKDAAPVSNTKRSTRTARSKVVIDLDQEEEVSVDPEEVKVQEVEPKGVASDEKCADPGEEVTGHLKEGNGKAEEGVASDEKCDDPEEEEVTGHLKEGNSKVEEAEQEKEVVSPVESIAFVMEEETTKPQEEAAIGEEQELVSAEKSAPMAAMEDSPILGVLSKVETVEPAIKNVKDVSAGDRDSFGKWSPVLEITDEINHASEGNEVAAIEVPKEDAFDSTHEAADASNKVLPAAVSDYETEEEDEESCEEDDINEEDDIDEDNEVAAIEVPKEDAFDSTHEAADVSDYETEEEDEESCEEDDINEEDDIDEDNEVAAIEVPKEDAFDSTHEAADASNKVLPAAVSDYETEEEDGLNEECSEEDVIDEEDAMQKVGLTVDAATGEIDCTSETDESIEGSASTDVNFDSEVNEECSEGDVIDEEDAMQKVGLTVDAATGEIDCTSETDEESDESIEGSASTDVNFDSDEEKEKESLKMHEAGEEINEDDESDSLEEEDDFSADLSPEFENAGNFSDSETESDSSHAVLEPLHAAAVAASSAAKTVVKSPADSAITEELEVSNKEGEVSQQAAVAEAKIDTIVKSLDEFTITEEVTEEKKVSAVGAKEKKSPSLRKLKSAYKERLIAAKEKKRVALEEKNDNVGVAC